MKKLRVGIIFGGRSGEHEVSVTSASSIFKHIDRGKYEPIAIRIEKDGSWSFPQQEPKASNVAQAIEQARTAQLDQTRTSDPALGALKLDVVFPVLHGPYGEDGTIQGLLEMAGLAYVGNGVLASAAGMDKSIMKILFAGRGLPVCRAHDFVRPEWDRNRNALLQQIGALGLPVFVKPANLGSSVGITKVKTQAELVPAIELALQFDRKIVVEAAVPRTREIECAVLGNDDPKTSVPGEILPSREFYDYEAKYLDEGSKTVIPADLPQATVAHVQRLAIEAFRAIDGAGLARVDFLMDGDAGTIYLNEINTLPGFTNISMYSKMWEASGIAYSALVDRLIQLGIERHKEKQQLKTTAL
ncbi:MAG TPA: D-alanine--D-alanine ligase family protein [Vicinamibacterales bacterium]|nr:D-alanine--D-alanine ligase family protein [Vicinamibacterales bacterium]